MTTRPPLLVGPCEYRSVAVLIALEEEETGIKLLVEKVCTVFIINNYNMTSLILLVLV